MRSQLSWTLMAALLVAMAASAARADDWSKHYTVSGKPAFTLSADNASVNVAAGNSGEVTVHVVTTDLRIPSDVRVTDSQSGNAVTVDVRDTEHWFGGKRGSVHIDVQVPAETDLNLHTGNGGITVAPVRGQERIETGNGQINANGLQGNLYFHTGNGHVYASGLAGTLEAHTGNGSLTVTGRFDGLSLQSGHGRIDATALDGSRLSSGWQLDCGVGSITLQLPSNVSADLDSSTGVGRITIDFPVTVSGSLTGSSVRGRIGNGGPTLRVHTGVGSVHIERAGT